MFQCSLCRNQCDEWIIPPYSHCSKCEQIRRIISLYDVDKVLNTLRFVYLRDEYDKVEKREGVVADKEDKAKTDIKIKTRSQTKSQEKNI